MEVPGFAFIRGRVVPYSEAKVGVLNHTLNYGTGVFGGMRGYWSEEDQQLFVFRPQDHFCRFLESAKMICMNFPVTADHLIETLTKLLQAENHRTDCYIRPFAYFTDESVEGPITVLTPDISIVAVRFSTSSRSDGLHVTFSSWRRIDDNMIPARGKIAGAYVNSNLAKSDALRAGFDDALLLNTDGHVAEGSTANLFMVRNGVVITPPVTDNILEGITRRSLMVLLQDELKCQVDERPIDRSEVYLAEEAFLCGTAVQVAPITRIDYRPLGCGQVGPLTRSVQMLYAEVVRGGVKKYRQWCMPVYTTGAVAR